MEQFESPRAAVEGSQTATGLNACCAVSYGHPLARWLLGDSFHPGGLALTARLARLMGIQSSSVVLDAGAGLGASAVHLARTVGCRVTGVTLEEEGPSAGYEMAGRRGVVDRVTFAQGDLHHVPLRGQSFDFVVMECVLSILQEKGAALRRLHGLLKPGGCLGLTDVTVSGPLPQELQGLLATAGCIGGALSLAEYGALLEAQGFEVEQSEQCEAVASLFLTGVGRMLLMAEVAVKLGKLSVGPATLAEWKRVLESAQEQARRGVLGYGLLIARRPESE
jgi:SAM-dependent methyltransferase